MADIDVVPKQRSNAWIWIVLAMIVVIAVVIWAIQRRNHEQTPIRSSAAAVLYLPAPSGTILLDAA